MSLRLSSKLTLPDEAVTETFGILAIKGAGKTYTAKVMTEEMVRTGHQVVALDPLGVWWGLRSSADGGKAGLPVVVLGGDHADVPLEPTSGSVIADFVVDHHVSVVLDMSGFRKAQMRRFARDFLDRLYHRNRAPLHLMIDEADLFAPQRPGKDETALLGAMEDIVRRGRARGLGATLITQRPAVIHKDVLTQISTLVCLRTSGPQDRAAIEKWIEANGTKEQRDEMMGSLASMPTGTAWFWSPHWLDIFEQVKVRKLKTFDSSATPSRGRERAEPVARAEVDLDALKGQIAETIERAEANDPKVLQRRIRELQADLSRAQAAVRVEERVVEVEVVPEDVRTGLVEGLRLLRQAHEQFEEATDWMAKAIDGLAGLGEGTQERTPQRTVQRPKPASVQVSQPRPADIPQDTPRGDRNPNWRARLALSGLALAERKILSVLAQHRGPQSVKKVAILTGYSHKGGGFRNALSSLRTAGYIEGRGDVQVTPEGLAVIDGAWEPLPTGRALVEHWRASLGKAESLALDAIVDAYPRALTTEEVAERTGYAASGGGFRNALSKLRTLGLAHGYGELMADDAFFVVE